MKKKPRFFILIFTFVLLLQLLSVGASAKAQAQDRTQASPFDAVQAHTEAAQGAKQADVKVQDTAESEEALADKTQKELLDGFRDALPDAAKDLLPEGDDTDALREAVGFRRIFSLIGKSVSGAVEDTSGVLLRLLGITLIFSTVALFGGFLGKNRFSDILFSSVLALFLYRLLLPATTRVFAFLSDLSAFSSLISPLYAAVFSSGAALSSAAVAGGGFTVFIGLLEGVVAGILSPLLRILFAFTLLSALGTNSLASQIEKRIRGAYVWILSLLCVLLGASLAFEGSLAAASDSVAARTVKFTVGASIPLVGSSVSSMLGTLEASLSLVKSSFGAGSLLVLLALLLPVLFELLLVRLTLSVGSMIAESVGASPISGVLDRFRGIFDLLLAAVCLSGAMFLLLIGILSKGLVH